MQFAKILYKSLIASITLAIFVGSSVFAHEKDARSSQPTDHLGKVSAFDPAQAPININNITCWVRGDGFHDWVVQSSWNGTFPKGTAGFIFAEGILWGGKVGDGQSPIVRVNGSAYSSGNRAGRILTDGAGNVTGREPDDPANVRPYRVRKDFRTADLKDDAANFFLITSTAVTPGQISQIRDQYERDSINWPWQKGAPFEDKNTNGIYDSGDIPGIPGADQTLWTVYNDLDGGRSASAYGSPSIGMEVQETYWAYALTNPLGNVIFKRARLIYKGTPATPANATIDSMYIIQWADPDNGQYTDDFAGCDTTLSLGYIYNPGVTDPIWTNQYGLAPPAGGYDFLQGVIVPGAPTDSALFDFKYRRGFKNLPMTVFTFFAAGSPRSDPDRGGPYAGTLQFYNLMAGFEPRPEYPARLPFYNHLGNVTKFELTGDPVTGSGDIDGKPTTANPSRFPPGDRRIVLSTGPFTMARGDTQELVLALVGGLGTSNLSSVTLLKFNDGFAQFAYNNLFVLPSPPAQPKVNFTELDGRVILEWGSDFARVDQTETPVNAGFAFEGYNVYQFPRETSLLRDAKRLATFDINNITGVIIDKVFDEETGFVIEKPVIFGPNSGAQRYFSITQDAVKGGPLFNGTTYYFAVTAYSFNPNLPPEAPFRILESSPVIISVTPQAPKPGVRYSAEYGSQASISHASGIADAGVNVQVIDPSKLLDANYTVGWSTQPDKFAASSTVDVLGEVITQGDMVLNEAGTAISYTIKVTNTDSLSGPITSAEFYSPAASAGVKALTFLPRVEAGKQVAIASGNWTTSDISQPLTPALVQELIAEDISVNVYAAPDTLSAQFGISTYPWYLDRGTTRILSYQQNYSLDVEYALTDGFQLKVGNLTFAAPITFFSAEQTVDVNPDNNPIAIFGDALVFGAPTGKSSDLFGGGGAAILDDFSQDLEFRFTGVPDPTYANPLEAPIISGGSIATIRSRSSGAAIALVRIPFELWEVERNRQINVSITDRNADGGSPWGDTGVPQWYRIRGRSYISAIATPYDATTQFLRTHANSTWVVFFDGGENGIESTWDTGDQFLIVYANPIVSGTDTYTFTTRASTTNADVAKGDVEKITVYPNPYYGFSSRERDRLEKVITIYHLPARATIRIFNMAGTLVRVIEKDDLSQFTRWNLRNDNNLPVASGIYIVHIDMPGLGKSKILKVALIQEEQILRVY